MVRWDHYIVKGASKFPKVACNRAQGDERLNFVLVEYKTKANSGFKP